MISEQKWSRTEKIGLVSVVVAIAACVVAILLPEVRQFLRLERPAASSRASANQAINSSDSSQKPSAIVTAPNVNNDSEPRSQPKGLADEKYIELADAEWKSKKKLLPEGAAPYSGYLDDKAIEKPLPSYPLEVTKTTGLDRIVVDIVVDESGSVVSAKHYFSESPIVKAAMDAAYKSKFPKPLLNGKPSKMYGSLVYKYPLQ